MLHRFTTEAEWLAARVNYITSTEVAGLFGLSRYKGAYQLFHEKRGAFIEKAETDRMKWGKRVQDAVAEGVAKDNGWKIDETDYNNCIFSYDGHGGNVRLAASIDRPAFDEKGETILIECKVVGTRYFGVGFDKEFDEIPADYEFQLQVEMMCFGAKKAVLACWIDGDQPVLFYRDADPEAQAAIVKKVNWFWSIVEDPEKVIKPDFNSEPDREAVFKLSRKIEDNGSVVDMTGNNRLPELCSDYKLTGGEIKLLEAKKDALKAEIMTLIGDAKKVIVADGYSISASTIKATHIEYDRAAYRDFRIFKKEAK